MPARDANNATWYVLRYPEDFLVRGGAADPLSPFEAPSRPYLEPTLLYDEQRGVLELQPEAAAFAADPPPGLAVDVDGDIYQVGDDGVLVVITCDGARRPLPCEPNILAQPAGLAIDRRGYLYVADPAAHRVVVVDPDDGSVPAILAGGLVEPIDVAIAPSGLVFVADRAGQVVVFSSSMKLLAAFPTAHADGKPPQPIAVMISADGSILVADAWLPRLLQYAADGTRVDDVDLSTLLAPLAGGDLAHGLLARAYGARMPRFIVGTCGPCATPADDGAARLAEAHRALRLLALTLGRKFAQSGVFVSRALDGGRPDVLWHRVEVEFDRDPPPNVGVLIETFTSETATPGAPVWSAPRDRNGIAIPYTPDLPEQIVQSPRGRFLWIRATLTSADGNGTASLKAIRAFYPRASWLDLLPTAYRRDPEAAAFTDRFLALFEHVFTGIENRYERFSREINPDAAPMDIITWLGALIDLAFDPSWPVEKRRALVAEAMPLYRTRGTVAGLERYVEIYTGIRPKIIEHWLERPLGPVFLGRAGAVIGCALPLLECAPTSTPDSQLWARYAHRFTIYVYLDDTCEAEMILGVVDRIVEANKPAHTAHTIQAIYPGASVGLQSRVGLDFVLGAAKPATLSVGDGSEAAVAVDEPGGVLGLDAVLGSRRPEYVRRLEGGL